MAIDPKLIDELLSNYKKPEDIIGENGLLKQLTKAVLERALEAEISEHLGYQKHDPAGQHTGNTRNGKNRKTLKGDFGELELETPRDRQSTFEPEIVAKRQTRWTGFDDKKIQSPLWDDRTLLVRWCSFRPWKGLEYPYDTIFPALKRWAIVREHKR